MISICVPIYEHDVRELVQELEKQSATWEYPSELILIDDASSAPIRELNAPVCRSHRYIELDENLGRSRIRNLFLRYANYAYLLFLDCDSRIPSEDFLRKYGEALMEGNAALICGGRCYPEKAPEGGPNLRWKYGSAREQLPPEERRKAPFRSFMTNNFLVQKQLLERIPFDERLEGYGHEDTLFGFRAKQLGVPIRYIDDPVLNDHFESNAEFLEKTEEGVRNLVRISNWLEDDPAFVQDVGLLNFRMRWRGTGLLPIVRFFYSVGKPLWRKALIRGIGGLLLFDLYKFGCLLEFEREFRKRRGDEVSA